MKIFSPEEEEKFRNNLVLETFLTNFIICWIIFVANFNGKQMENLFLSAVKRENGLREQKDTSICYTRQHHNILLRFCYRSGNSRRWKNNECAFFLMSIVRPRHKHFRIYAQQHRR